MSFNNPYSSYRTTQTITASQTQLIVMLHDGAIRFLAQAALAISNKDYPEKGVNFEKVANIVLHLWGTLDKERGGELAGNLDNIYAYMQRRLMQANLNDDLEIIKELMQHLRALRSSWAQVDAETKERRAREEPQEARNAFSGSASSSEDRLKIAA